MPPLYVESCRYYIDPLYLTPCKYQQLLFVGISFLLVNIWVNFLWQRISQPRRGGRLIYYDNFTLKQMLSFLRQAVDQIFETVKDVYIPKDNSSSLPSPAT